MSISWADGASGWPIPSWILAPVDRSVMRKLSEMTNEELEAAAQEAREELEKMTKEDRALVFPGMPATS
jgi:hypothetical protein